MICKNKNKECLAFLDFYLISNDSPICDLGYPVIYDKEEKCFYSSVCKKSYSNMESFIERKKRKE